MPSAGTTPRRKLVCLAGFMGTGKTTIGRRLARQLAWNFVDLDTRIEERAGLRITEIFDRLGEPAFRELERELLVQALGEAAEQDRPTVLALGGGTFAQPGNVELLRSHGGIVIWLDCPIEVLLRRCVTMAHRPLFRDEASFRQLYDQRRPFYQQADYRVESYVEPRRVIEQILALGLFDRVAGVPDASPGRVNA
jgi:shikimate kinase